MRKIDQSMGDLDGAVGIRRLKCSLVLVIFFNEDDLMLYRSSVDNVVTF